jgi:hypothetical protein
VDDCYGPSKSKDDSTAGRLKSQMVDVYTLAVRKNIMDTNDVKKDVTYYTQMANDNNRPQLKAADPSRAESDFAGKYKVLLGETFDNGKNTQHVLDALATSAGLAARGSGVSSGVYDASRTDISGDFVG